MCSAKGVWPKSYLVAGPGMVPRALVVVALVLGGTCVIRHAADDCAGAASGTHCRTRATPPRRSAGQGLGRVRPIMDGQGVVWCGSSKVPERLQQWLHSARPRRGHAPR
jgi:hypothetical protein